VVGDTSRHYLDVVKASVALDRDRYVFSVETAAPMPSPDAAGGERVELSWRINADRDWRAAQWNREEDNDYRVGIHLTRDGWTCSFSRDSNFTRNEKTQVVEEQFVVDIDDNGASVTFPSRYLSCNKFVWSVEATLQDPRSNRGPAAKNPHTAWAWFSKRQREVRQQAQVTPELPGTGSNPSVVSDPPGNLKGDASRMYLDVLETSVALEGDRYAFSATTAAPMPAPEEMKGGKAIDLIWHINADCDLKTAQARRLGNDYNIHAALNERGWHPRFFRVSSLTQDETSKIQFSEFEIAVTGNTITLFVPKKYLRSERFLWCMHATSMNSRKVWPPSTGNPHTAWGCFGQ
jgi:hypothetical protein